MVEPAKPFKKDNEDLINTLKSKKLGIDASSIMNTLNQDNRQRFQQQNMPAEEKPFHSETNPRYVNLENYIDKDTFKSVLTQLSDEFNKDLNALKKEIYILRTKLAEVESGRPKVKIDDYDDAPSRIETKVEIKTPIVEPKVEKAEVKKSDDDEENAPPSTNPDDYKVEEIKQTRPRPEIKPEEAVDITAFFNVNKGK